MAAAAEAPSVSLGAPRAPARHCGAPAAAAGLGATEVPGPLSPAGSVQCVWDAAGMLPRGEEGVAGWKKGGPAGSDVWQPLLVPRGLWVSNLPAGLQSQIAAARRHPLLMLGSHKTPY